MRTAVYRLYDEAGDLLYVGIGDMPHSRYRDHRKTKHWWPEVARTVEAWHDTREAALTEEATAIATEKPIHNVARWSYSKPIPEAPVVPTFSAQHVREKIRDRVDAALERGEHTVVTRSGRPVAAMVPYSWYLEREGKADSEP